MSRTSLYTAELGKEICGRLADGESLRSICSAEGMPSERTVRGWAAAADHPISTQYARAREAGYLKMAEELLEIADNGTNDYMVRKRGEDEVEVANHEHIARSKLRVDTRKWLLAKMLPKVYGDKVVTEHTGKDGEAIEVNVNTATDEFISRISRLAARGRPNGSAEEPH